MEIEVIRKEQMWKQTYKQIIQRLISMQTPHGKIVLPWQTESSNLSSDERIIFKDGVSGEQYFQGKDIFHTLRKTAKAPGTHTIETYEIGYDGKMNMLAAFEYQDKTVALEVYDSMVETLGVISEKTSKENKAVPVVCHEEGESFGQIVAMIWQNPIEEVTAQKLERKYGKEAIYAMTEAAFSDMKKVVEYAEGRTLIIERESIFLDKYKDELDWAKYEATRGTGELVEVLIPREKNQRGAGSVEGIVAAPDDKGLYETMKTDSPGGELTLKIARLGNGNYAYSLMQNTEIVKTGIEQNRQGIALKVGSGFEEIMGYGAEKKTRENSEAEIE